MNEEHSTGLRLLAQFVACQPKASQSAIHLCTFQHAIHEIFLEIPWLSTEYD